MKNDYNPTSLALKPPISQDSKEKARITNIYTQQDILPEEDEQQEDTNIMSLENLLGKKQKRTNYLSPPIVYDPDPYLDFDPVSGASITETSLGQLPHGDGWQVQGLFYTNKNHIVLGKEMQQADKRRTRSHEIAHARGAKTEMHADMLGTQLAGSNMMREVDYRDLERPY